MRIKCFKTRQLYTNKMFQTRQLYANKMFQNETIICEYNVSK